MDGPVTALYLVSAFPRAEDDPITPWLVRTIEGLAGHGVAVEVLAPAYRGGGGDRLRGIPVHRFRYAPRRLETLTHEETAPDRIRSRPWTLALVPPYLAAASRAAARLARSGRFDLVHAFWPLPHGIPGLRARRAGRIPLVSTFFGVELTWMRRQFPILRPILRRIVRSSDAVTAISGYTADLLRDEVPGTEPVRIPFGAAIEPAGEVPPPFPGPAGEASLRLLFVGRLVERKGVHRLLEAVALLPEGLRPTLTVVGEGPEAPRLHGLASSLGLGGRVAFVGRLPDGALGKAYRAADLVVLPAVRDRKGDVEGLGVVLIEGMVHGRPVIGSAIGGIPDVIRHEETGLLVPPDDPRALAAAIEEIARDPERARGLGEAGRRDAEARFGWTPVLTELAGLYRRLAGSRARAPVAR